MCCFCTFSLRQQCQRDCECSGIGFVKISNIFAMQEDLFFINASIICPYIDVYLGAIVSENTVYFFSADGGPCKATVVV